MSSLRVIEDKLNDLDYDFENCKNESEYKEICDKVLTLANELVEKLDNHYDKLNDIDEYIGYYIDNSIDYGNLKFYLKRDNMFTRELEDWLENYMRYYNKKRKNKCLGGIIKADLESLLESMGHDFVDLDELSEEEKEKYY